jgi:hypothetical protein
VSRDFPQCVPLTLSFSRRLFADPLDNPKPPLFREASAQKQASEHYAKMHAAGKTDQFKKDMERLREVKQRREKEAAERKAKDEGEYREARAGFWKEERDRELMRTLFFFILCYHNSIFLPIISIPVSRLVPCISRQQMHAQIPCIDPPYDLAEAKKEAEEKRQVRLAGKR